MLGGRRLVQHPSGILFFRGGAGRQKHINKKPAGAAMPHRQGHSSSSVNLPPAEESVDRVEEQMREIIGFDSFDGDDKLSAGVVLAPNGYRYSAPCNAGQVRCVSPQTHTAR